jgi:hypothetical protein
VRSWFPSTFGNKAYGEEKGRVIGEETGPLPPVGISGDERKPALDKKMLNSDPF